MIKAKNISKKYNDFVAVDKISFELSKGEIFAFLGPNGAGKTTTIKMCTALLKPTYGEVTINGFDTQNNSDEARKSFGIVFQDQSLDDELTAYENMDFHGVIYGMNKKMRKEKIEYLLKFVGLWDRRKNFIRDFSGGMKRRLEIARGLMHRPEILFLDEPTLGLDPQTRNHIWNYLKELNEKEKLTVFFTTHLMEEAEKFAHRIAIIDKGKIVEKGTPNELMKRTNSESLENAFLKITGSNIREESVSGKDRMRQAQKAWKKR